MPKSVSYTLVAVLFCAVVFIPLIKGIELWQKRAKDKVPPAQEKHERKPTVAPVNSVTEAEPQFYEYTVKKGDTLSEISERFYNKWVLYPQIARDNGITNPNLIFPDQKLKLRRPVNAN